MTTADAQNGHREPVRVYFTGTCEGLDKLREALSNHPELEVVGASEQVSQASSVLAGGHLACVLHATNSPSLPAAELAAIREQTPAPVIVLASGAPSTLLEEALEADVSDVLLLPQLTENVVFAIRKASHAGRKLAAQGGHGRHGRIVTVFAPKGGTGKTSIATNLAAALAKHSGKRTLLLDLDLQFGDVAIMMGIEPDKTIYDLVMARRELDTEALAGYVTAHQSGVHVLPAPLRPEDAELVTEERLSHLFAVAKESYDVVVVDTPPFFHGPVLSTLDRTDQLLLVASMDVPAIKNVKLTLQTLDLLHYPKDRRHLLLNQTGSKVGLRKNEVERALDLKVAFDLPSDKDVPSSINRGVPLALANPRAGIVKSMGEIVDTLVPQRVATEGKKKRRGVRS